MQSGSISSFISAYCGLPYDVVVFLTDSNFCNEYIFIEDRRICLPSSDFPEELFNCREILNLAT